MNLQYLSFQRCTLVQYYQAVNFYFAKYFIIFPIEFVDQNWLYTYHGKRTNSQKPQKASKAV